MPRRVSDERHAADIVVVRTRRGTVYAYVTLNKERKTLRITCKAFDYMKSVLVAEARIEDMFPGVNILWDRIQVERGVAFGWFD